MKRSAHRGSPGARGSGTSRSYGGVRLKTEEEIEGIRRSGRLVSEILDHVEEMIRPGITTDYLNAWVHQYTVERGAVPGPLNYRGFPKSLCTSVNQVVCHGIPDQRELHGGDILNVDVTCVLDGYYGDASRMYYVGEPSEEARRLVETTRECLYLGIEQVRPGNTLGDIGHVIQRYAEGRGYSVVRDLTGHGIGRQFHEPPMVLHYGEPGQGLELVPGMVFTIEPMVNQGDFRVKTLSDGWTVVTADGSLSAQWEHTVRVTESGVEILTARDRAN